MDIIPFSQIEEKHLDLVGTKALSVGRLVQAKFLVPEGFVITNDSLKNFFKQNDLHLAIQSELDKVSIADLHSIDYASRLIQELILSAEVEADLATEIMQQYAHSNSQFVAVRSSVYANGSRRLAWSGQLASYLHIAPEDLLQTIKKCWASLYTSKSLYYLLQQQLSPQEVSLSVIVQRMIDSKTAGICYSQHPVSGDKNQFIIEAGIGLGDANEDRPFTPDTYTVKRDPVKILDKNISIQEVEIISLGGSGTSMQDIEPEQGKKQKLTDNQIVKLVELVKKVEDALGKSVMVEWVYGDEFYLLQAREL